MHKEERGRFDAPITTSKLRHVLVREVDSGPADLEDMHKRVVRVHSVERPQQRKQNVTIPEVVIALLIRVVQ